MARAEVIMPQMGESIAEGTVVQWLKQVGDSVERDENLLEISTDKVDAEIPSPVSGTLAEVVVGPGQTVAVGTVIAYVETDAGAAVSTPRAEATPAPEPAAAPAAQPAGGGTDVIMPQMGESIAEGTVVQWLKQVGDSVERDENLLEISTDKVDAEIPSPVSGTLTEILVGPGQTVAVGTVIARVGGALSPSPSVDQPGRQAGLTPWGGEGGQASADFSGPKPVGNGGQASARSHSTPPQTGGDVTAGDRGGGFRPFGAGPDDDIEKLRRLRSSPLVRRIAGEHNIDLASIQGSGLSGRVTKDDIMAAVKSGAAPPLSPAVTSPPGRGGAGEKLPSPTLPQTGGGAEREARGGGGAPHVPIHDGDRLENMSPMRMSIAKHMVQSRRTSPHAQTVHEVDFANALAAKKRMSAEYAERGVKLTVTAFIAKACIDALSRYPIVNSSITGNQIVYRQAINLGVAVALEDGLIVPVIKHAEDLNLMGISRAINDLADRARRKKLKPDEVSGGTFTLTNPGVFGSLFGIPIINQPQVAILGCGGVKKQLVVNDDDSIAIRPQAVFCLSFDHRVVDGAVADHFMVAVKESLNSW